MTIVALVVGVIFIAIVLLLLGIDPMNIFDIFDNDN